MDELGLDAAAAAEWFEIKAQPFFFLVEMIGRDAQSWAHELGVAVRRCYIVDALVASKAAEHGVSYAEIIASKLPDAGSTMAGDFGEILTFIYQAAEAYPAKRLGPKKWRLKEARTKPAPYSDVVHFHLPQWPSASTEDAIFCSEVKTKSTDSDFAPIAAAIAGCQKDRTSRLAKTLAWLRERALTENLGNLKLEQLRRFIDTTEYPPAQRHFRAVAVVCSSLAQAELVNVEASLSANCTLVVIVVPDLKTMYTAVFDAAGKSSLSEATS
jgi:hypothetical protein